MSSDDFQSNVLKRYLDPMKPFRCTICLESFDAELQLQLHLLSAQHQERARPGIQKALMTLQSLNSGTLPIDLDVQPAKCPDSEQNPEIGFSLSNIPEVLLERLAQGQQAAGQTTPIPPAISAQLLLQQLESQRSLVNISPQTLNGGDHRSSNSSSSSRRVSEEQATMMMDKLGGAPPSEEHLNQIASESGIPPKVVKQWYKTMRQGSRAKSMPPQEEVQGNSDVQVSRSDDGSVISKGTNENDQFSDDDCGLKIVEPEDEIGGESGTSEGGTSDSNLNRVYPMDCSSNDGNDQSNRRMRTLISPDQAEVLYREYLEVFVHNNNNKSIRT